MTIAIPHILIGYARFLDPVYRDAFRAKPENAHKRYPHPDTIQKRVFLYSQSWQKCEENALNVMCRILNLRFHEHIIDVYIVGRGISISNPLVIHSRLAPDHFIDVLAHELTHRIFARNTAHFDVMPIMQRMLPNESNKVRIHVAIDAVLTYLYLDMFHDPHRLVRDIRQSQTLPPAYKRAWDITTNKGYKEVLKVIRRKK